MSTTLTIDRSRTALLCIDLVRDLAAPGGRLVREDPEALDASAPSCPPTSGAQASTRGSRQKN